MRYLCTCIMIDTAGAYKWCITLVSCKDFVTAIHFLFLLFFSSTTVAGGSLKYCRSEISSRSPYFLFLGGVVHIYIVAAGRGQMSQ